MKNCLRSLVVAIATVFAVAGVCGPLSGCATDRYEDPQTSPLLRAYDVQEAYRTAVSIADIAHDAGAISDAQWVSVFNPVIQSGRDINNAIVEAALAGDQGQVDVLVVALNSVLNQLHQLNQENQ